jgi:hypothetical protein
MSVTIPAFLMRSRRASAPVCIGDKFKGQTTLFCADPNSLQLFQEQSVLWRKQFQEPFSVLSPITGLRSGAALRP